MKLILNTSNLNGIDDVHKAVLELEKKIPDEYVCSSLFSVAIDAIENKTNIYKIPINPFRGKKIHYHFKLMEK